MKSRNPNGRWLSPHDIRALAVRALACDKTVAKYLRGEPVRATVTKRIIEALVTDGWITREEADRRLAEGPTTPTAAEPDEITEPPGAA